MNPQSSWQPHVPPNRQRVYGQQEWKQDLPSSQLSLYHQLSQAKPGQFQRPPTPDVPPPRRQSSIWRWYTSRTKKVKLSIVCSVILAFLVFFSCIGTAVGSVHHATPSAPTHTTGHNQTAVTSPGVRKQPTPILTPIHHQTPKSTIAPTHAPAPTQPLKATSPACQAVNNNSWCYNFLPGKLIYSPPASFCTYFTCVPSFNEPDYPGNGYVVQCGDGLFSQSGGEWGACWHHDGVSRPLYSH
jgi:hypothetical protein